MKHKTVAQRICKILIKKQTYVKTETCKLYSRVFWTFEPNFIEIDSDNFELHRFKVGAFFWDTVFLSVPYTLRYTPFKVPSNHDVLASARPAFYEFHKKCKTLQNVQICSDLRTFTSPACTSVYCLVILPLTRCKISSNISGGMRMKFLKEIGSSRRSSTISWSYRPIGQVVYSHCFPSFSAPRNWGTKGSFRRLSGYGD